MSAGLELRDCPKQRCTAQVATVLVVARKGRHKELAVDPDPVSWADGGRVRLATVQPGVAKHPLAKRLAHAGLAFGVDRLYRPHSETCGGGSGRTVTRRKGGHA